MNHTKIALIGFGEAARAFSSGWTRPEGTIVTAFDIKLNEELSAAEIIDACAKNMVEAAGDSASALGDASLVFSLVTADKAAIAAHDAALSIEPGALYLDCNSCSPATKIAASELIEAAGARYVDVAVMSPVHPAGHRAPLLVCGPHGAGAIGVLEQLGMKPRLAGDRIGQASSIKMLRSVMIKGLEALTAESLLAARRAGVEGEVIASLQASDPGIDWMKRSSYNLERMMVHGVRRGAEMREVARTVRELGLPDRLSHAIADWQDDIGTLHLTADGDDLAARADRILSALDGQRAPDLPEPK